MTIQEIEEMFSSSNPQAKENWEQVVRTNGMYTVALFAVSNHPEGDVLELAGTGTLVVVGDAHYILTAEHVWQEVLRRANQLGISLREHDDHKCLFDINTIVPVGLGKSNDWSEWGPDIVFLRIPPSRVGEIEAFRVFYRLPENEIPTEKVEAIEAHFLYGTPAVLGKFTRDHASVQIVGIMTGEPQPQHYAGTDYLDVEGSLPDPKATSFGGVSGGGLWVVHIYSNPKTGKLDSVARLAGVAYWALKVENGKGYVRCHDRKSIDTIVSMIAKPPTPQGVSGETRSLE